MTSNINLDDLFSSDILLYNLLEESQEDNNILQEHTISFPSQYNLINEDKGIFIGHGTNHLTGQTSTSDDYDNQMRIVVTNHNTDYLIAKTSIDIAMREVIRLIKESDLNSRGFRWKESKTIYTSQQGIKYRTLEAFFNESYDWTNEDYISDDAFKFLFKGPVVDGDVNPEETRFNRVMRLIDEIKELRAEGVDLLPYMVAGPF